MANTLYIHKYCIPVPATLVLYIMCPVAQKDTYIIMIYPEGNQEINVENLLPISFRE